MAAPRHRHRPSSAASARLSRDEQRQLVDVALRLLETLYVHLPLKRSMYAVNPLQRLKLLRHRLEPHRPHLVDPAFFAEMLSIFSQLRDLHTTFVLPEPSRSSYAYLPFRLDKYYRGTYPRKGKPGGTPVYVVSQLMLNSPPADPDFRRGSIVTHWNGTPIERVVRANAEREAGNNPAARLAQGLAALTLRWLGQSLPPDEDWVDVSFRSEPGARRKTVRFEWQVFQRKAAGGSGAQAIVHAQGPGLLSIGMDGRGETERKTRLWLFEGPGTHGSSRGRERAAAGSAEPWAREVFPRSAKVNTAAGEFAYVRIATFNVNDENKYIEEFVRLLACLPQTGLILDVRGNRGGLIHFGERLLQLLSPRPIEPVRFSFLNSACTEQLTAREVSFAPWRESIAQWVETGTEYSQGFPLLSLAEYNSIGQKYQGPVVLVTDALCYSTTDIFAAGFQDHRIGVVLGVDDNTGAGGANVWEYEDIAAFLRDGQQFPRALPRSASFRFAVRRVTRVNERSGVLLEDLGVQPDEIYYMTRRDVLERNADLIEHAGAILARQPSQRLACRCERSGGVRITYENLDRIDAYLGNAPLDKSIPVRRSRTAQETRLKIARPLSPAATRELRLEGFRRNAHGKDELVASTRLRLPRQASDV